MRPGGPLSSVDVRAARRAFMPSVNRKSSGRAA